MRLLGTNILIELFPEKRMESDIFLPDEDSIRVCKRCHMMMEHLREYPCVGEEIYEHDKYHDRPVFRGIHFEHDIEVFKSPVVESPTRRGTVRAIGQRVRDVSVGDIVYIAHTAGGATDEVRFVQECEILMKEEE